MKLPYFEAFVACCLFKLNAALATADTTLLEGSPGLLEWREQLNATNDCSAIKDSLGCKVDNYCQCNGKDYDGCTQCYYGSACHVIDTKASICMPLAEENIKSHKTGTNCLVDDYQQCGGYDYEDCQRCKPGSTCTQEFEDDDRYLLCVPTKHLKGMQGRPGLDDDKVRKVAKLMVGVDEQLDKDADDEEISLDQIRLEEMYVFASEKGKERLKELAQNHDPDYEEAEAEVEESWDDYCELVSQPNSMVSQETKDCLCNKTEPAMHCVAKLGVELDVERRRALQQDEEEEEDDTSFNLEDVFDTEELKKALGVGTRNIESMEEEALEEAWKNVQDSLEQNPEFNGDVLESLAEAQIAAEEALRKVYESDEYDFSEFGKAEVDHPFGRNLGGSCDIAANEIGYKGSRKDGPIKKFFAYANAMIKFVTEGKGCLGVTCAIPIPKMPLEAQLALKACVAYIPSLKTLRKKLTNAIATHAYLSGTTISLTASLCLKISNRSIRWILRFLGLSTCFLEGGFTVYPLIGKLESHIAFGFGLIAKFTFTILYDDYMLKEYNACNHPSLKKDHIECQLCEGGTEGKFEMKLDMWIFREVLFDIKFKDDKCGQDLGVPKASAMKALDERQAAYHRARQRQHRQSWRSVRTPHPTPPPTPYPTRPPTPHPTHRPTSAPIVRGSTSRLRTHWWERKPTPPPPDICGISGGGSSSCSQCPYGHCGGRCYLLRGGRCVNKGHRSSYACNHGKQNVHYCGLCPFKFCEGNSGSRSCYKYGRRCYGRR